jgi:hypothetical protein
MSAALGLRVTQNAANFLTLGLSASEILRNSMGGGASVTSSANLNFIFECVA